MQWDFYEYLSHASLFFSSKPAVNNLAVGREWATPCTYWTGKHFSPGVAAWRYISQLLLETKLWMWHNVVFLFIYLFKPAFLPCKWPLCGSRRQSTSLGVSWLVTLVSDKKTWWQCSRESSYAGNLLLQSSYTDLFQKDISLYIYGPLSRKQGDSSVDVYVTNTMRRHKSCKQFNALPETAGGSMQ